MIEPSQSLTTPVDFTIDLTGPVALVTGASSGLGARFARVLAACGAKVALAARRLDRLEELADEIVASGGVAMAFALDMRDDRQVTEVVGQVEAGLGAITILVNNAGITDGRRAVNMAQPLIDDVIGANLRGPYILSCEVVRRLIASGTPGRVVNVSSIGAFTCTKPGQSLYSTSKAALIRMTEVLAVEFRACAPGHALAPPRPHGSRSADDGCTQRRLVRGSHAPGWP